MTPAPSTDFYFLLFLVAFAIIAALVTELSRRD